MRTIDADALEKALEKEWDTNSDSDFANKCVWRVLENAPTVEPERKKGKWITSHVPESILWECNQCGFPCGAHSFNFCPNCGCEMER